MACPATTTARIGAQRGPCLWRSERSAGVFAGSASLPQSRRPARDTRARASELQQAPRPPASGPVPTHKVTVHDRQRGVVHEFVVPEDQYILHTAEAQDISLPFACRHVFTRVHQPISVHFYYSGIDHGDGLERRKVMLFPAMLHPLGTKEALEIVENLQERRPLMVGESLRLIDEHHQLRQCKLDDGRTMLRFVHCHGCCTSCAVRIKSGQIRQPEALGISAELKDQGYALLCVGFPSGDVEVETQDEDEVYWLQFGRYFARGPVERDDYALELAMGDE